MKKTIIFSDTHLTKRIDQKKLSIIKQIVEDADTVIINGDLWEHLVMTFDQFIASEWNTLFDLLKKKQAIYVTGNHDRALDLDQRTALFSLKTISGTYTFTQGKYTYEVKHGHEDSFLSGLVYTLFFHNLTAVRIVTLPFNLPRIICEYITAKTGVSFLGFLNLNIKNMRRSKTTFTITSHTHAPEIDYQKRYINTGFINAGYASYVVITDKPRLMEMRY